MLQLVEIHMPCPLYLTILQCSHFVVAPIVRIKCHLSRYRNHLVPAEIWLLDRMRIFRSRLQAKSCFTFRIQRNILLCTHLHIHIHGLAFCHSFSAEQPKIFSCVCYRHWCNWCLFQGFNIHINGSFHCCLRYKQLHSLHEQLKKSLPTLLLPTFPSKKLLPLTPNQLEQRRASLERYIQLGEYKDDPSCSHFI